MVEDREDGSSCTLAVRASGWSLTAALFIESIGRVQRLQSYPYLACARGRSASLGYAQI